MIPLNEKDGYTQIFLGLAPWLLEHPFMHLILREVA